MDHRLKQDHLDWFFNGDRNTHLPFVLNEWVHVLAGEHAGRDGLVCNLLAMKAEPIYLIEPTPGRVEHLEARASELDRLSSW